VNEIAPTTPLWAIRLGELCRNISAGAEVRSRPEAWQIVHFNLARYLRYHATRVGRVEPEDLDDIASQKTLELMRKVDMSSGPLTNLAADRVPGFLSTVARNGLLKFLKKAGRTVRESDEGDGGDVPRASESLSPAVVLESREYARALSGCVGVLEERARTLWLFRVCYGMSSKDIARHPRVGMAPNHVDVVLHRVRQAVRECMRQHGHETERMPPGTFSVLWQLMHPLEGARQEVM